MRTFPDGTISFSVLNDVQAAGLTPSELSRMLTRDLSVYVRNPLVKVFVKEYLSKRVFVLGALNRSAISLTGTSLGPGVYPLKGRITALDQILEAGGPTPNARLNYVRLIRNSRSYIIDLQRLVKAGNYGQNVILEPQDILQVSGIPVRGSSR